ncbi:MAG TPA: PEP-CTERM sorting domain-containing protein [Caulobacteraceae bacterium]|nr:PEP-CTERM sorting domain-containing protein [Caulobacteraceae bacterium]
MFSRLMLAMCASAAVLAGADTAAATPLFVSGSSFSVDALNSPDTFLQGVNLTPGTQSLDGGKLNLQISIVSGGGAKEWLVFDYTTASGGPLVPSTSDDWHVYQTGLDAARPVDLVGAFAEFFGGGTPTSSIFGNYSVGSNPVPGETGTGFVGSFPAVSLGSGPLPALGSFISPFGFLNDTGINSANVTGYLEALEFAPTSGGVPEPSSWALMLAGAAGLGWALRRRRAAGPSAA